MSLVRRLRLRARDKALAASRRLSTGPEWERHVREEFALLAPPPGGRDPVVDGFHRLYYDSGYAGGTWADTRWFGWRPSSARWTCGSTRRSSTSWPPT